MNLFDFFQMASLKLLLGRNLLSKNNQTQKITPLLIHNKNIITYADETNFLLTEKINNKGLITFNRPNVMNTMTHNMIM